MKILITGAAGGIGIELVKYLAVDNDVIGADINTAALDKLKKDFNLDKLKSLTLDVANKNLIEKEVGRIDSLDVLINCAGVLGPVCLFGESDLDRWRTTIEINLMGTVYLSYYCLPLLLKARRGKIINFSGGGSAGPRVFHSAYGSAKTAVVRFSETIAGEYPDLDINAIAPGAYKTGIWAGETHDKEPENWGDIERLKKFIGFLCSEKSDGITGKFIHYKDNWETFGGDVLKNDIYTLRRVEK